MPAPDLLYSIILFGLVAVFAVAYLLRVLVRGKARFDRIDRDGGSNLLSKDLMQMMYWVLQPVARLLVFLRVSANAVSWASLVFGILAGACLTVGHFGFGAAFAVVASLADAMDGLVARLSGSASDSGEVLDATIDRYNEFFYLAGLVIYYREFPILMSLALFAMFGSFMVSYSTAKAEALQVTPPRGNMRRSERAFYLTLGAALSPITIPWIERSYEFSVSLGYPMIVALGFVAVLSNFSAIERFVAIARAVKKPVVEKAESEEVQQSIEDHAVNHGRSR